MPAWVSDKTGRLVERPKYSADEIERICEREISTILIQRYGTIGHPVTDDDLTVLVEQHGAELDLEADFSAEAGWVQGETEFRPGRPPLVRITKALSNRLDVRYRTTLAHEAGHVLLLKEAYDREENVRGGRYARRTLCDSHDWPEWQADQCIGALLMPQGLLAVRIGYSRPGKTEGRPFVGSPKGQIMISQVAEWFQTSLEAARVRLVRTGYLRQPHRGLQLRLALHSETTDERFANLTE
jgi:hypothetical protein